MMIMYDIDDLIEPQNKKKNIFAKHFDAMEQRGDSWQYERLGEYYPDGPLVGREYQMKRKGYEAHVEMMNPNDYYRITGRPAWKLEQKRIDAVKEDALKGEKISMPWLQFEEGKYVPGQQEGHHRIWAARELGAEKVPVVMVNRDPKYIDRGWPPRSLDPKKKKNPFTFDDDYIMDVDW